MTDLTGRSFLSYRRARRYEAELLITAQHDHGIPTWQDIHNLDETPTEAGLREVLLDSTTANAVLWITPEVADSLIIRNVEAPLILRRTQATDGFFLVPAAAGGLDYHQAPQMLDQSLTLEDLEDWNLRKIESDPIGPAEAASVAHRVLQRRLAALHKKLPQGELFRIRLFTRTAPPFESGFALTLDWTQRFRGREAELNAWDDHLLPALRTIAETLRTQAPGRRVEASGLLAIPAAAALGCAFLALRGLTIAWRQPTVGRSDQLWSLEVPREESGFIATTVLSKTAGLDLAVMVSVASNVEHAVAASRDQLPPFRAITKVTKDGPYPHLIQNPGKAVDIAYKVVEAMRKARD